MSAFAAWSDTLWIVQRPDQAVAAGTAMAAIVVAILWIRGRPRRSNPVCGRCRHPHPPRSHATALVSTPCAECGAPADLAWHGAPQRRYAPPIVALLLLATSLPAAAVARRLLARSAVPTWMSQPSTTIADHPPPQLRTRSHHPAGGLMSIRSIVATRPDDSEAWRSAPELPSMRVTSVRIDGVDSPPVMDPPKVFGSVRIVRVPKELGAHELEIDWEQTISESQGIESPGSAPDSGRSGTWRRRFTVVPPGAPVIELVDDPARSPWPGGRQSIVWLQLTDLGSSSDDPRQLVVLYAPPLLEPERGTATWPRISSALLLDGDWWIRQDGKEALVGRWLYHSVEVIDARVDALRPFELVFRPRFAPDARHNRAMAPFAEAWWNGEVTIPFQPGDLERVADTDDPTWVWRGPGWEDASF